MLTRLEEIRKWGIGFTNFLLEDKHVFAKSHYDMKGTDPNFHYHHIQLQEDAKPIKQQIYRMNPNYALWVKEDIDKLLKFGFIKPVNKVRMAISNCYALVSVTSTVTNPFPLLSIDRHNTKCSRWPRDVLVHV